MFWFVLLVALVTQSTSPIPPLYQQVSAALASGDLAGAQNGLERLTELEPRNARAWMLLAQTYARRKNPAAAATAALKAEAEGSSDAEVLHGLAFLFTDLQPDLNRAAGFEARYAEKSPADKEAWRRVARLYHDAGRPDQAIAAGLRGLTADPSAELHTILGQAYAASGDWQNATLHMSEAVRLAPYDEDSHFRLAQLYMMRQDFTGALGVLSEARKTFARSPQIELSVGVCQYGLRLFPEAVRQFLKTIALAPDVIQPYLFLGRMLDQTGDRLPEVTERFASYNRRHPEDAAGYLLYAKALVAQLPPSGFPPEAEKTVGLLEQARALKADDPEVHYQLGCLLERKRDYPAAASELERSVALDTREPAVHFHLARVYERLGRQDDAARERDLHQKLTDARAK